MPAKIFIVSKKADRTRRKLPTKVQARIVQSLDQLQQNSTLGAKLGGELTGNFKFRVGDYRIVYKFNTRESKVEVVKIEHRQGVYK